MLATPRALRVSLPVVWPTAGKMCNVLVRGFDFDAQEDDLVAHCSTVGRVEACSFKKRGSAIVTFASEDPGQGAWGAACVLMRRSQGRPTVSVKSLTSTSGCRIGSGQRSAHAAPWGHGGELGRIRLRVEPPGSARARPNLARSMLTESLEVLFSRPQPVGPAIHRAWLGLLEGLAWAMVTRRP